MAIGWGIVGIGRHPDARMAPAIRLAQGSKLVAVCSRDQARAEAFAQKHGSPFAYSDYETMLQSPQVDAVYVASPNALHKEHTLKAAQAGKHVLCEKPMALSLADCQAMLRACRDAGVLLGVGFHLRHHPAHIEARRCIQRGEVGELVMGHAQWARGVRGQPYPAPRSGLMAWWDDPQMSGGGSMMATGVHAVDLLRFVTGREVMEVAAFTDGQSQEWPLEHLAVVLLKMVGGFMATVTSSRRIPDSKNNMTIYGSAGRIFTQGTLSMEFGGALEVVGDRGVKSYPYLKGDCYQAQVEAFNKAIQEGSQPNASGMDGLRVAQVTLAIFESAQTGRAVKLEPVGA